MTLYSEIKKTVRFLLKPIKYSVRKCMPKTYKILIHSWQQYNSARRFKARIILENRFVEYRTNDSISPLVKLIAFYSPSVSWENALKAKPAFKGHYQPHHPLHFGCYDLKQTEVMMEQAKLAKEYGIYGFSYHFYWSNDKAFMEEPLKAMLHNKMIDMPFCLTWMNEDQIDFDKKSDALALFRHLIPYFKDARYVCIESKPVFIIYQTHSIVKMKQLADIWREEARKCGLLGIYLIAAKLPNTPKPEEIGFDALLEFPPDSFEEKVKCHFKKKRLNSLKNIFDYQKTTQILAQTETPQYKLFRGVMLSFDSTTNPAEPGELYHNFTAKAYQHWLSHAVYITHEDKTRHDDEKMVFINAWNAWERGTHLEPDERSGFSYLQNTYDAIKNYDKVLLPKIMSVKPQKKNNYAVILHLFFEDLWPEIRQYLSSLNAVGFDLYVSVTSVFVGAQVKQDFPDAYIQLVENRGRDILPFIKMLTLVEPLGYAAICKIHSKKSIHDEQVGKAVRTTLFDELLGSVEIVANIIAAFNAQRNLGLMAPKSMLLSHREFLGNNEPNLNRLCQFMDLKGIDKDGFFPAGSMFWFRPQGLKKLLKIPEHFFGLEHGAVDGEYEHAVERFFCIAVQSEGYQVLVCSDCKI